MKLIGQKPVFNQSGTATLVPEEPDDLWLAYNIIHAGDIIAADTTRKVNHTSASGDIKGSSRVKVTLEIKIASVDYDKDSSALRVRGKNLTASQLIPSGAFHTLELQTMKQFDLKKKLWDAIAIDALQEGCNRTAGADLAVILMQQGLAQLYLVGNRVTTLRAKIEGDSKKFFENVLCDFEKHVDFNVVRCVVIASPGSIKDEFRRYLLTEAQRRKLKSIEANKSRIVLVKTSSGTKNSLKEVLHDTTVVNMIKDAKAVMEIRAFTELSDMLSSNSDRACYGPKNVETAHEMMAIETLLITDDLVRNAENATRQKYIDLVNSVKKAGGNALVFSSMHVSGEQLTQLTGIAAILRFPLPDLDEMEL